MVKVAEPVDPSWLASPAYDAEAVAVPAPVLSVYDTGTDWLNPPAPVTVAVHGSCAEPV